MEELLQLHVVIPEEAPDELDLEIQGGFDDVHDLIWNSFPVPNNDVPSYDHLGMTVSSSLFERRSDNLEHVENIEAQLNEWYPSASVFRSSYEQSLGEFRSPADPDSNIMLLVTNWGVQQPAIRWKQQKETLQAPPLVLGNEIFHANYDGIFAIDSSSGDVQWEVDYDHVIQAPVGNANKIIGNIGNALVALDRSTGDVQWRTEFDPSEDEIIDSRVVLGSENAYVGLRTGDVVEVSLTTGDREVLCASDSSILGLRMIEPGLIVMTNGGGIYLIDSSGKSEWPEHADFTPSILHSQDGNLYATAEGSLLALTEEDGTVEWQIDFPAVNNIVQTGDTLVATTTDGLVAVNAETGNRIWDNRMADDFTTVSNTVVIDSAIACVSSSNKSEEDWYTFDRNILHIFDPSDGSELQKFELGVGDCYGPSAVGDAIVCSAGGELICLENIPDPA